MGLGYGSFGEYVERIFGYSPRLTQEKLRLAEALEGLPQVARKLRTGEMSFSGVRELTRVATRSTESAWLAAAKDKTVREIERLVSGHRPGNLSEDPVDAGTKRHVLRFEVSGEVLATLRDAMATIRRDAGKPLDDDAAILLLSRHVLGGPKDEGRSSYQVALTVCERCRAGVQHGRGERIEVGAEVVEMAACDAQYVGHVADGNVQTATRMRKRAGSSVPDTHVGAQQCPGAGVGARVGTSVRTEQSFADVADENTGASGVADVASDDGRFPTAVRARERSPTV